MSGVRSVEEVEALLTRSHYVGDREIATAIFLAIRLHRPLLVEGHAGVGKTEIAKTLATALNTQLIRLQCYEGLDVSTALYEWNYAKQILRIRMEEQSSQSASEKEALIFSEPYLMARPLLQALRHASASPVLLIDEIDRADEEFEAFLLEVLAEYQVTIPELGSIKAEHLPYVVLTSNRVRELSDALKRRCLYLWIDYPSFEKELAIIRTRLPETEEALAGQICRFMEALRETDLDKRPGVAETLDWGRALSELNGTKLTPEVVRSTLGCVVKSKRDIERVQGSLTELLERAVVE
ncbi:MAG: MoxR family ATPase [Candidatus Binatus sp.]|jgi:MoxR-like ATPase|uniref:AAA family ATPase n=1 Tax=Candidatus Binatus sp. TaxID=2811406 RepID=UPI003BAE1A70